MKLLYQGAMWAGSTTLQRFEAFANVPNVIAVALDTGVRVGEKSDLYRRVRWKLRWPVDEQGENEGLFRAAAMERPDVVLIDGSRVVRRSTLKALRGLGVRCLVYYTPDDIIGTHNLSWPLRLTFSDWDVFFTTKTFNVPELGERGVRRPVLIGNAFDPKLHRPMSPEEAGEDYESFDAVFIGSHEKERRSSINAMAEAGLSVVVYGGSIGAWPPNLMHRKVVLREARFAGAYTAGMHHGKIALCFLRKLNRDRITTRTVEIAAMGRPMLAEKTDEHDAHFIHGCEYVGFGSDDDLIAKAKALVVDPDGRALLARRGMERCWTSRYSVADRTQEMLTIIRNATNS